MFKIKIFVLFFMLSIVICSCGEKPSNVSEIKPGAINLSPELKELLQDSAKIIIYDNKKPISAGFLTDIQNGKNDLFVLNLSDGEHLIEVYLSGPNENVVYMLDRVKTFVMPDIKNSIDIELGTPLKFDKRESIDLYLNKEVSVSVKIDNSRLPEGITNPQIHWSIDNIENGSSELGIIIPDNTKAIIKGPSALPSPVSGHYLGAYYEANGKKFISVIKINYLE